MKKILGVIALLTALLICATASAVCSHGGRKLRLTMSATCTKPQMRITQCVDCGEILESIPMGKAPGHSYILSSTKNSTCAEAGYKKYTCSRCGDTKTESLAKESHNWNHTSTKDSTCIICLKARLAIFHRHLVIVLTATLFRGIESATNLKALNSAY